MNTLIHDQSEARGVLLVLLTSLIWGTTGTVQTLGPEGIDPLLVGAIRIMIGGLLISLWSRRLHQRSVAPWSTTLVMVGALAVVVFQLAFFTAVQRAGVVIATVTTIGTTPVFAGFFARIFLKEPLRRIWYLATAISIVGVVLLTGELNAATVAGGAADLAGFFLALLAAIAYSAQTIIIRNLVQRHPPEMVMSRLFLVASLLVVPLLFARPAAWIYSFHGTGTVLYLGVVATSLAYILFSRGLRSVGGAVAGTVSLAEPAAASLFGFILLGESIPSRGVVGILCIGGALVMITLSATRRRARPREHVPPLPVP